MQSKTPGKRHGCAHTTARLCFLALDVTTRSERISQVSNKAWEGGFGEGAFGGMRVFRGKHNFIWEIGSHPQRVGNLTGYPTSSSNLLTTQTLPPTAQGSEMDTARGP